MQVCAACIHVQLKFSPVVVYIEQKNVYVAE